MTKILALSLLALGVSTAPSLAQNALKLGVLDCEISGGTAFIIGSAKALNCEYRPADGGPAQRYGGSISKFGVDIGQTNGGNLQWAVFAVADPSRDGALAGNYYGVNAEASVITGGGANLLVGGLGSSFTLQPLSGQVQTGLNLAVAVAGMNLQYSYK